MAVLNWWGPGLLKALEKTVVITWEEPRRPTNMAGKLVQFWVDTEATYSVLTSHTGPLAPKTCSTVKVEGKPKWKHFITPLTCTWGKTLITHKFLVILKCPNPLLGRDFLSALDATLTPPENQNQGTFLAGLHIIQDIVCPSQNICPKIETLIDP